MGESVARGGGVGERVAVLTFVHPSRATKMVGKVVLVQ